MLCNINRLIGRAAALAALGTLAACGNMAQVPPNTPLADVSAQFGSPNFRCETVSGVQRVIWTQQPFGQYAWGANVGADGRVDQIVPILTDAHSRCWPPAPGRPSKCAANSGRRPRSTKPGDRKSVV